MQQTLELPLYVTVFPKKLPQYESFLKKIKKKKKRKKFALVCEVVRMACLHPTTARPAYLLIALQLSSHHFMWVKLFPTLSFKLPDDLGPVFLFNFLNTQDEGQKSPPWDERRQEKNPPPWKPRAVGGLFGCRISSLYPVFHCTVLIISIKSVRSYS